MKNYLFFSFYFIWEIFEHLFFMSLFYICYFIYIVYFINAVIVTFLFRVSSQIRKQSFYLLIRLLTYCLGIFGSRWKLNNFTSRLRTKRFITVLLKSSRSQTFYKIDNLQDFWKFIGKHLCWGLSEFAAFQNCCFSLMWKKTCKFLFM